MLEEFLRCTREVFCTYQIRMMPVPLTLHGLRNGQIARY